VTQNAYPKEKFRRDIATNINYYCFLRHQGDLVSLKCLSTHLAGKALFFPEVMEEIARNRKGKELMYLLVNLHENTELDGRFKYSTNIFPIQQADGTYTEAKPMYFSQE
jgi:hypothetical protein